MLKEIEQLESRIKKLESADGVACQGESEELKEKKKQVEKEFSDDNC
jgi:hypothetical protein